MPRIRRGSGRPANNCHHALLASDCDPSAIDVRDRCIATICRSGGRGRPATQRPRPRSRWFLDAISRGSSYPRREPLVEVGSPIADQTADPDKPRPGAVLSPPLERARRYWFILAAEIDPGAPLIEYLVSHRLTPTSCTCVRQATRGGIYRVILLNVDPLFYKATPLIKRSKSEAIRPLFLSTVLRGNRPESGSPVISPAGGRVV